MQTGHDRIVVYDVAHAPFLENRAFDLALMRQYPGAGVVAGLAARLKAQGVRMMTADRYLAESPAGSAVVLSNEISSFTRSLILERGLHGAVCMSGESPIMARPFYMGLPETSAWYDHVMLFPGFRKYVSEKANFHDFFWPNESLTVIDGEPWSDRSLLTLVCANKSVFAWPRPAFDWSNPKLSIGRWYRIFEARMERRRHVWMQTGLHDRRLEAIRHFGGTDGFDLYGRAWDQPIPGADRATVAAVRQSYRGEIPALDKLDVLGRYRFSICFENSILAGNITEKVFDCLRAGNIPVYLGAPDVTDYIPAECFIDFRRFSGFAELEPYLREMSEGEADGYRAAGRAFLESADAAKYTEAHQMDLLEKLLMDSLERLD